MRQEKVARQNRVNKYREAETRDEKIPDVRDEKLAEETGALLEEIECCLAETVVTDEEAALKVQAREEWDSNEARRYIDERTSEDYWYVREAWMQKYREVVTMKYDCCGQASPVWDE